MALTKMNTDLNIIAALDDEPNSVGGLSAAELKAKFDESGNAIKTYINETLTAETDAHIENTDNPHTVTAAQVGLGNCDNTADIDKPVSTPQQEALNLKANSDNVLEKNNDAEYNPTANYHPATKKYVDDTVGQAVLGSIPDGTITEVKLDASLTEKINNAAPELHASQHAIGGSDPLTPADIGAAENLLPDDVATALGLTGNPQVKDALNKLKTFVDTAQTTANGRAQIATGSYTGTGTFGESNPTIITSDFPIKMIALGILDTYDTSRILERQALFNLNACVLGGAYVRMPLPQATVEYIYFALSSDGKTVRFYSNSSYNQYNAGASDNGGRYKNNYYVAIG